MLAPLVLLLKFMIYLFMVIWPYSLHQIFFSGASPSIALMNTFAVFFIGFVTRPVGALMFGWVGDFVGRKPALLISIALMSVATGVIGFLPTYNQIGSISIVILILARLFQGISVGGEYIGSVIYLYESAPQGRKIFFSSFAMVGSSFGVLLASIICLFLTKLLTPHQMLTFGWRLPFLLALPGGGIGFLIKSGFYFICFTNFFLFGSYWQSRYMSFWKISEFYAIVIINNMEPSFQDSHVFTLYAIFPSP